MQLDAMRCCREPLAVGYVRDTYSPDLALGVDPQQDLDTMPGTLGHPWRGHSGVQDELMLR
jgi:hypothetical protein